MLEGITIIIATLTLLLEFASEMRDISQKTQLKSMARFLQDVLSLLAEIELMSQQFLSTIKHHIDKKRTKLTLEQGKGLAQQHQELLATQMKFAQKIKELEKYSNKFIHFSEEIGKFSQVWEFYDWKFGPQGRLVGWARRLEKWHNRGLSLSELQQEWETGQHTLARLQDMKRQIRDFVNSNIELKDIA